MARNTLVGTDMAITDSTAVNDVRTAHVVTPAYLLPILEWVPFPVSPVTYDVLYPACPPPRRKLASAT